MPRLADRLLQRLKSCTPWSAGRNGTEGKPSDGDADPGSPAPSPADQAPQALTDVKYVDHVYNDESECWEYVDTDSDVLAEAVGPIGAAVVASDWQEYCFVVVRRFPLHKAMGGIITFRIIIKSSYLLRACKDVMGSISGMSWNANPVELSPELLLTFLPQLESYEAKLRQTPSGEDDGRMATALGTLLAYMKKNYQSTLEQIANLTAHGEMTFDLLYAVLVPRTVFITRCSRTGEPRAVELLSSSKTATQCGQQYSLVCRSVEAASPEDDEDEGSDDATRDGTASAAFGWDQTWITIPEFKGTRKINSLSAFPLKYHPEPAAVREKLIKRGRKWAVLNGVHHVAYRGLATDDMGVRYSVNSRVMIDRANFTRINPNAGVPQTYNADVRCEQLAIDDYTNEPTEERKAVFIPSDDMLLLASPLVYGFGLSDKMWLRFNVEKVAPIEWNNETFEGLVLPTDRKTLLRSLVEAHGADDGSGFDDFVRGKGQGLVINLFGPPGVGKTLSAEATSEHIRRPLYVVGSGELGTTPSRLDETLGRVFDIATCWGAIVLIDEADVFLEQRSLHDIQRNAMVAVFLRHIEYYRGILFLTTNRINTFDEAFLSRIHVALHYTELSAATKAQIWRGFLKKAGLSEREIPDELVAQLAQRDVNGRQIKNACRTATSLARSRGAKVGYEHLMEALDAMEEFIAQFAAMRGPQPS